MARDVWRDVRETNKEPRFLEIGDPIEFGTINGVVVRGKFDGYCKVLGDQRQPAQLGLDIVGSEGQNLARYSISSLRCISSVTGLPTNAPYPILLTTLNTVWGKQRDFQSLYLAQVPNPDGEREMSVVVMTDISGQQTLVQHTIDEIIEWNRNK